jgi:hypothetical protein
MQTEEWETRRSGVKKKGSFCRKRWSEVKNSNRLVESRQP